MTTAGVDIAAGGWDRAAHVATVPGMAAPGMAGQGMAGQGVGAGTGGPAGGDPRHDRDRDAAGRPRQARPRDALGRPLPYGAEGVEPVPEQALPPQESVRIAGQLIREGRPFAAHEVLEARWKAGPPEEGDLWQGLAQVCVGLTHAARGNTAGAVRLLERGAGRLDGYGLRGGPTYGLDLSAIAACARRLAEDDDPGLLGRVVPPLPGDPAKDPAPAPRDPDG